MKQVQLQIFHSNTTHTVCGPSYTFTKANILASKGGSRMRANFQKEGVNLKI